MRLRGNLPVRFLYPFPATPCHTSTCSKTAAKTTDAAPDGDLRGRPSICARPSTDTRMKPMPPLKTTLHAPQLMLLAMLGAHASNSLADTPKLPPGSTITAESHFAPPAVLRQVPLPGNLPTTLPVPSVPEQEAPDPAAPVPKAPVSGSNSLQARSNAYTPLCTSLSINQLYTLSGVQRGAATATTSKSASIPRPKPLSQSRAQALTSNSSF